MKPLRFGHIGIWVTTCLGVFGAAGAGIWHTIPCEFLATGRAESVFVIDIPYQEFRTLIIRNDATKEILERDGFKLLQEELLDLKISFGNDKRPVLNALFGKSKSIVKASKRLTVGISDPNAGAAEMVIIQNSHVTPQEVSVESASEKRCGDIVRYMSSLNANPTAEATSVRIKIETDISKPLSPFLHSIAQSRLDKQVHDSVEKQILALKQFVDHHRMH